MKVILTKTYEIKEVADGYARNYLMPKGLAVVATAEKIKEAEQNRKKIEQEKKLKDEASLKIISSLANAELKIAVKTNEDGGLFAALPMVTIIAEIKKQFSLEVDSAWVELATAIKKIGVYEIKLKFPNQKQVSFKLNLAKQ
ncbi:MAG: 50S ribosomal protein L9 [Candidatus Kerfeldbacteria bacterium RIFOXYA2_FULL_38_24]|uniref:Large ribosomal subunit protein bL9 n=1 Tax=Candidatus Kerfeldbacteria bacterium RIFOXYB2_FULL_38_14 TaxID=1798547 RepID=A0A1G2B9P3_9BACT|nr:MAG: 50S ribosomal protein L9 [Candidatus Kerfeldbacteria bacterium RIFOXYA2_FULL_38_24]OGY85832.1 MAG: 50S ribosomal protein L9 [Candidatus Kerfeldbacteria bacterium RIFOXYB2_FULL_38_14]